MSSMASDWKCSQRCDCSPLHFTHRFLGLLPRASLTWVSHLHPKRYITKAVHRIHMRPQFSLAVSLVLRSHRDLVRHVPLSNAARSSKISKHLAGVNRKVRKLNELGASVAVQRLLLASVYLCCVPAVRFSHTVHVVRCLGSLSVFGPSSHWCYSNGRCRWRCPLTWRS